MDDVDERDSVSYEEFGGTHDYVNCPTCQGTGRVPSSQSQQLVALVPYDDERLKPKRTALWVTVGMTFAVVTCGLVCGLLVYFLIPRTIDVLLFPVERNFVQFGQDDSTHINFTLPLKLSNPNFQAANLTAIESEISFMRSQVGGVKDKQFKIIQKRTNDMWHNISCSVKFDKENHLEWMTGWCGPNSMSTKTIPISIQVTTNVTFRGTPQQTAIKQLCYVSCDPKMVSEANCS